MAHAAFREGGVPAWGFFLLCRHMHQIAGPAAFRRRRSIPGRGPMPLVTSTAVAESAAELDRGHHRLAPVRIDGDLDALASGTSAVAARSQKLGIAPVPGNARCNSPGGRACRPGSSACELDQHASRTGLDRIAPS